MTAHMTTDPAPDPAAQMTGPWLTLSAALTGEIPVLAGREDLIVACTPGAGRGAPACFLPALATVEIDGTHLGVDPATCQPSKPSDRDRYPGLWGALIHEAAHAAHTRWDPPHDTVAAHHEAAMGLEESRIEAAYLDRRAGDRHFLRACVTQIVRASLDPATVTGEWAAGQACALILARADAGVLDEDETRPLAAAVRTILGADRYARLQEIWQKAHQTADDDHATMLDLGRRWCDVLGTDPDQPPPEPGDGTGQQPGNGDQSGAPSVLADAVEATLAAVDEAVKDDSDPAAPCEQAQADARQAEADAQQQAAKSAQRVFGPGPQAPRAGSAITGSRPPSADEQAAARRLARALRAAAHHERAATTVTSATPPGRLKMRAALARDAQQAAGATPTAEPFSRTMRRHTPSPPLRLGIACDVSGSMELFTGPVASTAWILARATSHLTDASSATVTFGHRVSPVTYPGHAPASVPEFGAVDYEHRISQAIDALDAALSLSRPGATRLLVIVSDGDFEPPQRGGGQNRITRLIKTGCAVLWLAPDNHVWPMDGPDLAIIGDPVGTAAIIAKAATRALRNTP